MLVALLSKQASGQTFGSIKFPAWSTPILDPKLTTHTCYSCLRSQHNWIFDIGSYYKQYATATEPTVANIAGDGMECCQDTYSTLTYSNCPKYKQSNGNIINNRIPSEQLNPDLALAACPNWEKICGA